jgi:hypothetical protein
MRATTNFKFVSGDFTPDTLHTPQNPSQLWPIPIHCVIYFSLTVSHKLLESRSLREHPTASLRSPRHSPWTVQAGGSAGLRVEPHPPLRPSYAFTDRSKVDRLNLSNPNLWIYDGEPGHTAQTVLDDPTTCTESVNASDRAHSPDDGFIARSGAPKVPQFSCLLHTDENLGPYSRNPRCDILRERPVLLSLKVCVVSRPKKKYSHKKIFSFCGEQTALFHPHPLSLSCLFFADTSCLSPRLG